MATYRVTNLTLTRIGETDEVIVKGNVNEKEYEVKVWYSHLYGTHNKECLQGNTVKIRTYCQHQLVDAYKADPTNAISIEL